MRYLLGIFFDHEDGDDSPPERGQTYTALHGVAGQKILFIATYVRNLNTEPEGMGRHVSASVHIIRSVGQSVKLLLGLASTVIIGFRPHQAL
jgi:hypothetical protein